MTVRSTDPVARLIDRETVFITPTATVREIAERLWWQAVGVVIVGTAEHPLGVVSERDVVGVLAKGTEERTTAAAAVMRPMICARAEDSIQHTAAAMLENAIRHLPVTDQTGRIIGVVSIRDVVHTLLIEAGD